VRQSESQEPISFIDPLRGFALQQFQLGGNPDGKF